MGKRNSKSQRRKKRFHATQLLHVVWRDSYSLGGVWHNEDDLSSSEMKIHSVGWLLKETNRHIVLVAHWELDNQQVTGDMTIPKSAIIYQEQLFVGKADHRNAEKGEGDVSGSDCDETRSAEDEGTMRSS